MPRAKVEQLPLSSELRPVASLVDTYEKPAQSSLRGVADALGTVDKSLQTFLQTRDVQKEQEDALRGQAAYYQDSSGEFAKAVTDGKIPAQYSPFYVRGFKNAQGAAAGDQLRAKWQDAWDNWQGKDSENPEDFHKFFQEFVKTNVGTQDPDVLRGVMPTVEALQQNATTQFTQYRHDKTVQGSLTAHGAMISSTVQQGLDDGQTEEKGADYKSIFGNVNKVIGESLAKGDPGGKAVDTFIDVMSAKVLESRDPKLMDWFSEKVPGQDYTYGETPHGIEVKNATMRGLEEIASRQATGMKEAERKEMERLKDEAQSGLINQIIKDPSAPLDEKLLTQAEKNGDPLIKVHVKQWQADLAKGSSDPQKLMHFYDDIASGRVAPKKALDDALAAGVFGTPEDMRTAYTFAESFKTSQSTIEKALEGPVSKQLLEVLRQRTQGLDAEGLNPLLGTSNEGLEASADFRQLVTRWIINNPNATPSEIDDQVSKFGQQLLKNITPPSIGQEGVYNRDANLPFQNPYTEGQAGAPSPADGQQGSLSQDPAVQKWEKENSVTPDQAQILKSQADKLGMGYDEYIHNRVLDKQAEPGAANPNDPLKKVSYNPNEGAQPNLTPELASSYIETAFSSAQSAGLNGDGQSVALLDLIGKGESDGNYNAVYGNPGNTQDLSQYTLDDILKEQQQARSAGAASTAIGKYGFLYKTLLGLKSEMGLSGSEKFNPELQDKLGKALLNRRGLEAYKAGRLSKSAFALALSQEFASLPNPNTGASYYAGDGLNRSRVGKSSVYQAMGFTPISYSPSATGGAALGFDHPDQAAGVNPQLKSMVADTFKELGLDNAEVISGYRSPSHPSERNKKSGGGEHTHGNAMDVSMKGLSDQQRAQLVNGLIVKGAKRFITYGKYPDMLHVDLKDQTGNGAPYFMHDKSARNLRRAPAWFQSLAGNV